jgi:hypothetical protein
VLLSRHFTTEASRSYVQMSICREKYLKVHEKYTDCNDLKMYDVVMTSLLHTHPCSQLAFIIKAQVQFVVHPLDSNKPTANGGYHQKT